MDCLAVKILANKPKLHNSVQGAKKALKWIVISGVATYLLTQLLVVLDAVQEGRDWEILLMYAIVNTLIYASHEFKDGEEK